MHVIAAVDLKPSEFGVNNTSSAYRTSKLSYRKDDRAMRPMYGCPENSRESLSTPTTILPKFFMGFCSDRSYECAYKIWSS